MSRVERCQEESIEPSQHGAGVQEGKERSPDLWGQLHGLFSAIEGSLSRLPDNRLSVSLDGVPVSIDLKESETVWQSGPMRVRRLHVCFSVPKGDELLGFTGGVSHFVTVGVFQDAESGVLFEKTVQHWCDEWEQGSPNSSQLAHYIMAVDESVSPYNAAKGLPEILDVNPAEGDAAHAEMIVGLLREVGVEWGVLEDGGVGEVV